MAGHQGNPQQDRERQEHAEDHQGDGNGRGQQDAPRAGAHAAARPYAAKIRKVIGHLHRPTPITVTRSLLERETGAAVGIIVVSTDRGLCGALNAERVQARAAARDPRVAGEGRKISSA